MVNALNPHRKAFKKAYKMNNKYAKNGVIKQKLS